MRGVELSVTCICRYIKRVCYFFQLDMEKIKEKLLKVSEFFAIYMLQLKIYM